MKYLIITLAIIATSCMTEDVKPSCNKAQAEIAQLRKGLYIVDHKEHVRRMERIAYLETISCND